MLNRVVLMGRMATDPELKQTPNGVSVATFRLAVERNYQQKDSNERICDFINCVAWRQTGEFITRYFSKGSMIAIEGSIQTRQYQDKNGNKRTAVEVIADHAYFAGNSGGENGQSGQSNPGNQSNRNADAGHGQTAQESQFGQGGQKNQPAPGGQYGRQETMYFGGFEDLDDSDLPF